MFLDNDIFSLGPTYFLNNSLQNFVKAIIIFLFFVLFFNIFQKIILKKLKTLAQKIKTDVDDVLIKIFRSIKTIFYYYLAFYLAIHCLVLNSLLERVTNILLIILVIYQVAIGFQVLIDHLIEKFKKKEKEQNAQNALFFVGKITKWVLWIIAILLILSNLGVEINSLIAGLGITGIAVALAVQNILGDLFSSLAIYFDKPFTVGDYIVVGESMGIVKKIGFRSTKIQSSKGEELIISNKELTTKRIQNFKRLKERRNAFSFGIDYDVSSENLKKIPQIVREIIEKKDQVKFERIHLIQFGDFALIFECVYYEETEDYNKHKEIHQEILFEIKEAFEKNNIVIKHR